MNSRRRVTLIVVTLALLGSVALAQDLPLDPTELVYVAGSKDRMTWLPRPAAVSYGIYRGTILGSGMPSGYRTYNHECVASEVPGTSFIDSDEPEPGIAFYHLVTGLSVDAATGAVAGGPPGFNSAGNPRPEGLASCGSRVFVDPDVVQRWGHTLPYTPTGRSWQFAYTSISEALRHPQPDWRSREVWIRGTVVDPEVSTLPSGGRAFRLLGGFSGAEYLVWERRPQVHVTTWDGNGAGFILNVEDGEERVLLDGLIMRNAATGIGFSAREGRLTVRDVSFQSLTSRGISLVHMLGPAEMTLTVERSRFDATMTNAISVQPNETQCQIRIADCEFAGATGDIIRLASQALNGGASIHGDIVRNRFRGGLSAIAIDANYENCEDAESIVIDPVIAANEISETTGDAIRLNATVSTCYFPQYATREAVVSPTIVANTIVHPGGAGIACAAERTGPPALDQAWYKARCEPQVWDNLVTFAGGFAIAEGPDDPATFLVADPRLVGNNLWGCARLYRDEGTTELTSIAEVNALPGAADNWVADPLYRDLLAGDFRLQVGSPAIDRAHPECPSNPILDVRRKVRGSDGDGDGVGRAEVGANELK